MSLVSDIINQAFIDLGVITPNETITASMQADAFTRLNQLLGSLSAEGYTVPNQSMQQFNLFPGVTAYTLGVGGSFNTAARAMKVTAFRAVYQNILHSAGRVISFAEFGAARQAMGETTPIPAMVAADTSFPLINVRVFPPPSFTPGTLELAFWTALLKFATKDDPVNMPDGWEDVLHFHLALRLYPQYGRAGGVDPGLLANAQQAKQALVSQNTMSAPPAPQQAA